MGRCEPPTGQIRFLWPALVITMFAALALSGKEEIEKMNTLTQQEIAEAIKDVNAHYAWLLTEGKAGLQTRETTFVRRHTIIDIRITSTSHPIQFFIARNQDGSIRLLTGNPSGFNEMMKTEGVQINEQQAPLYTEFFVDMTDASRTPITPLNGFDDVPYSRDLTSDQLRQKQQQKQKFQEKIKPPVVKKDGSNLIVQRFYLKGKELQLRTFTIAPDGTIQSSEETIDKNVGIYDWI
jgi:hypothetical protein